MKKNVIEVYMNLSNRDSFHELFAKADINNESHSSAIGKAVIHYMTFLKGKPQLVAGKKEWDDILDNMSREDLIKTNKLIFAINNKIMERL